MRHPSTSKSEQPAGKSAAKHSSSNKKYKHLDETRDKTKVDGARRIWGTIKPCSSEARTADLALSNSKPQPPPSMVDRELSSPNFLLETAVSQTQNK